MEQYPEFRIKLRNYPDAEDYVSLDSFGAAAKAWASLLQKAGDQETGENIRIGFVVTDVRVASLDLGAQPRIIFEEVDNSNPEIEVNREVPVDLFERIGQFLNSGLQRVENGARPDEVFPEMMANSVYELISPFHRDGVETIELQHASFRTTLTATGAGRHRKLEIREKAIGSVIGDLTSISFNRRKPYFGLRAVHGDIVQCTFDPTTLLKQVKAALCERVEVFGRLERNEKGELIRILEVWDLDVLPDSSDLPSVDDLYGSDPDFTGEVSSVDWVRSIRGEA